MVGKGKIKERNEDGRKEEKKEGREGRGVGRVNTIYCLLK
jgi:hypothetical protein